MPSLRQTYPRIYNIWGNMKKRCLNPNDPNYINYGARGITIYKDWYDFEPFCVWALNNGYEEHLQLDRKDNNGNYTPNNCHWTDNKTNSTNRRTTKFMSINGETHSMKEWSELTGISYDVIRSWIRNHDITYAEKRIEEALLEGYSKNNYGYGHEKPVILTETKIFNSVKEAAEYTGLDPHTITNSINNNYSTSKGVFEWLDENKRKEVK